MEPQVPINVDEFTGIWDSDGMPMLYVPRHFFINNHLAIAEAMGNERYAEILYPAGYKSAYFWCKSEAKTNNLSGMAVFTHYLRRISQRGWGLFSFINEDLDKLEIKLEHSAFVLQAKSTGNNIKDSSNICYMCAGWFAGAADWVATNQNLTGGFKCYEKTCAIHNDECVFIIERSV